MGIFFTAGEKKIRPGVYQRYENIGTPPAAGAVNGICAAVFRGNWGPINKVMTFESSEAAKGSLGSGGKNSTVSVFDELFTGGAIKVHSVRLGTGGTKGTTILIDSAETGAPAMTITTKYESDRAFIYAVREVLGDEENREFVFIEGTTILEKIVFAKGKDEVDTLVALINSDSKYVTAQKVSGYTGTDGFALVAETAITPGTEPTVTNESYSTAFLLLEAYRWNTISVDTDEIGVHLLLGAYMNRVYNTGKMGFAVVGEPITVALEDRIKHAKAFNDYNVIFVGGGWKDAAGISMDGWKAVARIAGMVASVPSSESLTHRSIYGATEPLELLTNAQYEDATLGGMLTFSASSNGVTWIENGITTLVAAAGQDDEGWKKIKRAKVRFELMTRISDTIEPLIGVVINNSDGQANIIKTVKGILLNMVSETKLLSDPEPEIFLDPANPPQGDSAWFIVRADDSDAVEKAYFVYRFRYTPNQL